MSLPSILSATSAYFSNLSKKILVKAITHLRDKYLEIAAQNQRLASENSDLKQEVEALKGEQTQAIVARVNKAANQPSSKQPEWESKGVGNDGKGKKKGRGKKGRKGAGNRPKNRVLTKKETAKVGFCHICKKNLSADLPNKSYNVRIIEDIAELPVALEVIEVKQEKKYCPDCKQTVTARSTLALPRSDVGINTTIAIVYYWVVSCLSLPKISSCLQDFFTQSISTTGLSKHLVRVSEIMRPVYQQLQEDIKSAKVLHADETGWRVKGNNWWLWVFGSLDTAYYTIDSSRGKDVVCRVMGEIFQGVLVVDGWRAYLSVLCEQQSCMAHLLRKIRNLNKAFPQLSSVHGFYTKFRKILRDGEQLQGKREQIGEQVFNRRLSKLHKRLNQLLEWPNPNDILIDIIAKVRRQQPRILTYVQHPGVPCHNNFGEYLIRIGVIKRKMSYGSKSKVGADAYAVLLSIHTTCKLRHIPFADYLKQSLKQYIRTGIPMPLEDYQRKQSSLPLAA
ncbi:MAG: IS66 family transposase [Proteobacteria bacterium]|nr:IS66 family transposase [Pseudomonadota bacterium]